MNVEQEWLTWYNALKLLYYYQIMGSKSGCLSLRAYGDTPTEGYRLAANYCDNYDLRYGNSPHLRYGNSLNGPSRRRIAEVIDFIDRVEAREKVSV